MENGLHEEALNSLLEAVDICDDDVRVHWLFC